MVRGSFLPMAAGSHTRPTNPVDWRCTFQPYPLTPAKWRVSVAGGMLPAWRRDGKELFFFEPGSTRMMAVDVVTNTEDFR